MTLYVSIVTILQLTPIKTRIWVAIIAGLQMADVKIDKSIILFASCDTYHVVLYQV